eukprot:gene9222-19125_t
MNVRSVKSLVGNYSLGVSSLQSICTEVIVCSIDKDNFDLQLLIQYNFPGSFRNVVIRALARKKCLTSEIFLQLWDDGLQKLDLSNSSSINFPPDILPKIWFSLISVESINLNHAEFSGAIFSIFLTAKVLHPPSTSLLLCLDISNSDDITDLIVEMIAESFHNLQIFQLSSCPLLSELALTHICNGSLKESLTDLNYSHNFASTDTIESLEKLQNIQKLSLSGVKNVGRFYCNMPSKLIELELMDLSHISLSNDDLLSMLTPVWKQLKSLKLTESNISSQSIYSMMAITTTEVEIEEKIGENIAEIHSTNITTTTIATNIYNNNTTKDYTHPVLQFTAIDLSWCDDLSSEVLGHLLGHCPLLTSLILRVSSIDSIAIQNIAKGCPNLTELLLPRCTYVDDNALLALAKNRTLVSLDLSWTSVHDNGVLSIIESCVNLEILILEGCKEVTIDIFTALEEGKAPRLRLIDLGWVNMCSKYLAEKLSKNRSGLLVSAGGIMPGSTPVLDSHSHTTVESSSIFTSCAKIMNQQS